jgi:ribosome-binding protein aMBF1 (putative translation factor)/phage-related protein
MAPAGQSRGAPWDNARDTGTDYAGTVASTRAVYYRDAEGREPVNEFLDGLGFDAAATIDLQIDRLNGLPPKAPPLPFPHSSQVDGPLRELRCHYGNNLYRVLYRRSRNLFVLLHIFRKGGATLPPAEIAVAKERWEDFERRMNVEPRVPPRAAGHDAPSANLAILLKFTSVLAETAKTQPPPPSPERATMPDSQAHLSPVGSAHRDSMQRRARSAAYQRRLHELGPYERIARMVIWRRMNAGWTQLELAERVGTSHSVISRIESGQHATSVQTLARLANAFDTHLVVGFDDHPKEDAIEGDTRQLAAVT